MQDEESSYRSSMSDTSRKRKLLGDLMEESISIATDYDKYHNIKDSFENYQQRLDYTNVLYVLLIKL